VAKLPPREPESDLDAHRRDTLDALIGEQVMHALGEPADLFRVRVQRLWENYWRVNVYLGVDAASARVAHSYFVLTDDDGNILTPDPAIIRQY
jgi:hypothetical protein